MGHDVCVAKLIGADKKREATTLAKAIGAEITDLRTSKGWSQADVAQLVGYSEKWVRSTEMGANTTGDLLAAMAFLFSLKLSDLVLAGERRVDQSNKAKDSL
jgi:transcriptional regulator with XRE-family HTH domain